MICPQCESYVSENMAFCPFCGFKVNPELTKPPVSKETNPKTEIGNTNFFGSAFPHKQEEEDFGLITSTIENPQIEESEDFSGRMFSALSEMISNTEIASYETAKQAVQQQDEIIQSDSAPSQTAEQAEKIIEQVEEQINDSADQQLSETVQQADDALTETENELPEQTQDAQEQNADKALEQISEASEQLQQETEQTAEETVEQTDETAEQAEQTIEQVEDETAKQAEQADEAAAEAEEIPVLELADTAEQTDEDTSDLHQDSMENPTEANNIPAEEEITEPEQEISAEEKPAEAEQSDLSESEQQDTEPEQEKETSVPEQENTEAADDQADKAVEQAEQPDESAPEAEETVEKAAEPEKEAADEDNPAEPEQENSAEVKNDEPKQEMPAEENITAPEQEDSTEKEQETPLSDEEETEEYLQQAVAILYGDDFKKSKTDRRVPYVPVFAVQDNETASEQEKSAETADKTEQAEQESENPDTDKNTAEEPETVKEAVSDIDKNNKIIELSANKTDTIKQAAEEAVSETAEQTQDTAEKETEEEAAEENIQKSEEAEKPSEAADEDNSQAEETAQDDEQAAEGAEPSDETEEQDEQPADDNEDDTQDDEEDEDFYEIKRSFFPDSYPSVDYSKLPANDAYRRYQQQKDKATADNGTYDDYAYEDIDQGPDILSDIRYREEPTEDNSTISVSDTLKKASGKLGSIFRKKSNDEHNSDGNGKPKRKHRLLFITKKEEMEEIKPFVVTFDDDFVNSHTSEEELPPAIAEREAAEDEKAPAKKAEKPEKTPKKTAKTSDIKKLIPIIGAAAAVLVVAIALILIISSSKGSYKKNLFPEVYYDNGKIVLLKSERAEDKHNIASSGVESLDDVHYFNDIGCIYYVKNNDLYCYTISKLESMRIVRNVYSYSFFDDGKKVCAVSEDGKVYCFNGKDIAALSKGNDPVKSNSLSYVCGDNYSSALYLDGYNTATGSAILCKLDKSCKGKAILEIPAGTKKIEYFLGKYIMLTDSSSTGMLYDLSGKPIAPFEGYSSTVELGENSLIIRCGDSYDLFSKNEITDFDSGATEILAVSKTADKFCYKASNGICYYYNNGKINDVCDASANSKLLFDIDGGCAYGIINDILFYYNIGKTVKQTPVCNGIKDVVFDENSRTWLASDDNCILKLDGSKASEITYEKTRDYPMISSDGKSFLAINSEGQLVKLTGNSESVISDNVTAFDSDSSFKNIVFVSGDRIYLNELESKITTVRDPESFQFCEAE